MCSYGRVAFASSLARLWYWKFEWGVSPYFWFGGRKSKCIRVLGWAIQVLYNPRTYIRSGLLVELNQIRWACRRGMLELDLILTPFLENVLITLDAADQKKFEQLLECEDQDLYAWLMNRVEPQEEFKSIV